MNRSVVLPPAMWERLAAIAAADDRSINSLVRRAVEMLLKAEDAKLEQAETVAA